MLLPYELKTVPHSDATEDEKRQIKELMCLIWPEWDHEPVHDANLKPVSFMLFTDNTLASYAAVVSNMVRVESRQESRHYYASGLSCVCTHPNYRNRGYGSTTVRAATDFILKSDAEFGVFTSDPELVKFYGSTIGWPVVDNVEVVSGCGTKEEMSSKKLGKKVYLRLFSQRALNDASQFQHCIIDLNLGPRDFW